MLWLPNHEGPQTLPGKVAASPGWVKVALPPSLPPMLSTLGNRVLSSRLSRPGQAGLVILLGSRSALSLM